MHTIGDRAAKITLDAIETVLAGRAANGRFRLEHAQILTPVDLVRAAKMGGESRVSRWELGISPVQTNTSHC